MKWPATMRDRDRNRFYVQRGIVEGKTMCLASLRCRSTLGAYGSKSRARNPVALSLSATQA